MHLCIYVSVHLCIYAAMHVRIYASMPKIPVCTYMCIIYTFMYKCVWCRAKWASHGCKSLFAAPMGRPKSLSLQ